MKFNKAHVDTSHLSGQSTCDSEEGPKHKSHSTSWIQLLLIAFECQLASNFFRVN